ncbi:unnamed protein product [marine sediment metagenome]|uniref:Uncharacterized protein n=1 Tax=marine sediment metagenome TaxID=412755 RepID=X1AI76_9ZZZZ
MAIESKDSDFIYVPEIDLIAHFSQTSTLEIRITLVYNYNLKEI